MLKNIGYEQAIELLSSQRVSRKMETVPLEDALGRVLAEDIFAAFPMPPFDKSPFDGFAFRAGDLPGTLAICGEAVTGCEALEPLAPRTAMRIYTGAPVPAGADVIVKQEDVERDGDTLRIPTLYTPGFNIIRQGEDYEKGARLLEAGTRLDSAQLGALASQGIECVPVYCKPKALFVCTGTELSDPGEPRRQFGIYNSSYYSLSAYLRKMNFDVVNAGTVPDERGLIVEKLREGLQSDADLVLTTGGASVGDYDFALSAAQDLGLEILFWKVFAKPGGALMAACADGKLYLALSGNPAAAIMSLLVVAQPYLRKLTGSKEKNEELELPLLEELPKWSSCVRMLRGREVIRDGKVWFRENPGRGNGNISSFAGCDMIGIVPAGKETLAAGTKIKVLRLPHDLC